MENLNILPDFLNALRDLIPLLVVVALFVAILWFIDRLLKRNKRLKRAEGDFRVTSSCSGSRPWAYYCAS